MKPMTRSRDLDREEMTHGWKWLDFLGFISVAQSLENRKTEDGRKEIR